MAEEELEFEVEPESPENGSERENGKSRLIFLVAVAGLILGTAGIVVALMAKSDLAELRQEIASRPDPLPELRIDVDSVKAEIASQDAKLAKSNSQLGTIVSQTQRAFEDIMREMKANREEINKSGKLLNEMGKRIGSLEKAGQEESAPPSRVVTAAPVVPSAEKLEDGYHIIESGDNFDKLAKLYGSTIEAFLRSNPGIDPRRLQIGQKIKIPE